MFTKLNDGTTQNLITIFEIFVKNTDVIYKAAKGSIDDIVEHFETKEEAEKRYEQLQKEWLC